MITPHLRRSRLLAVGGGVLVLGLVAMVLHTRSAPAATEPAAPSMAANPAAPDVVALSPEALANVDLQYANAEERPAVREVTATGPVTFYPKRFALLTPLSKSRVVEINVDVGDHVRAGETLEVLDAFGLTDVRSRIAAATAGVVDAKAALVAADAALTRGRDLVASGTMSQGEVQRRRAMVARAQATYRTRQAELLKWRDMQRRFRPLSAQEKATAASVAPGRLGPGDSLSALVAPFDGIVIDVGAGPGSLVDATSPLITLANASTMWVQAAVPESEAGAMRLGEKVTARVDAYPGRRFEGRVVEIAKQVDAATGTLPVSCAFDNADGALLANMFASVNIQVPLGHDAVLVPDAALQESNGQMAVFVPTGKGRFRRRVVRTGYTAGGMTEVMSGLAAGTPVVAAGSYWLMSAVLQSTIPDE